MENAIEEVVNDTAKNQSLKENSFTNKDGESSKYWSGLIVPPVYGVIKVHLSSNTRAGA